MATHGCRDQVSAFRKHCSLNAGGSFLHRMALELELNLPPPSDCDEREALNRTRTWLNCYCVDGSHAIQFGKMPMLRLDDYMARTSQNWYRSSSMNTPYDVHLVAYVQILIIMAKWRASVQQENNSEKVHVLLIYAPRI